MWHPDAVQQELYRQMDLHAQKRPGSRCAAAAPSAAAGRGGGASVPEQIQQLADLRDRGTITAAEFEAKKAQLLERM